MAQAVIGIIGIAIAAAGTGVAVAGQIEQAEAAEKAGKYNQAVADNNALAAQQQAKFEADRISKRNRIILGRQKAAVAKAGILDTGSTLDVFFDSAVEGELDRMAAIYSGQVRSGYATTQGQLARMEAESQKRASYYRAGGTLLSGTGQAATTFARDVYPTFGED
jgi:hypothetical protein